VVEQAIGENLDGTPLDMKIQTDTLPVGCAVMASLYDGAKFARYRVVAH